MSVSPCVEKFNIVSNLHGCTQNLGFSALVWLPFLGKFVPKNQNVQFKLVLGLIWTCREINGDDLLFCFQLEIPFLCKVGPKNQNCQFKMKCGTLTNSNMQNSMVMLTLSVFDWNYPFWADLVENGDFNFSWNLAPWLIQIYAEFSGGVPFLCFRLEIPFLGKFGQNN